MKISLITTLSSLKENDRIKAESLALGHEFELINTREFSFQVHNNELIIDNLTSLSTDLVILRGIFNAIKPITESVKILREKGIKVFDNNLLESQYSINKIADLILLAKSKIPLPDTAYTRNFDEYFALAEKIGYPVIMKSTRMGKGAGIYKIENNDDLSVMIEGLKSKDKEAKGYILQEFVPYVHDLRVLVIGNDVYPMKRIPQKGDFRANFSLGGTVEKFELSPEGKELAINALKAVNLQVGGVDVLTDASGKMYILEVNHVAGMVGMELALKENITKKYLEYVINNAK